MQEYQVTYVKHAKEEENLRKSKDSSQLRKIRAPRQKKRSHQDLEPTQVSAIGRTNDRRSPQRTQYRKMYSD